MSKKEEIQWLRKDLNTVRKQLLKEEMIQLIVHELRLLKSPEDVAKVCEAVAIPIGKKFRDFPTPCFIDIEDLVTRKIKREIFNDSSHIVKDKLMYKCTSEKGGAGI